MLCKYKVRLSTGFSCLYNDPLLAGSRYLVYFSFSLEQTVSEDTINQVKRYPKHPTFCNWFGLKRCLKSKTFFVSFPALLKKKKKHSHFCIYGCLLSTAYKLFTSHDVLESVCGCVWECV